MTPEQLTKKRLWFAALFAYFIIGYTVSNYFNLYRTYYFNMSLPFEDRIPFVPLFILGYLAVYLAVIIVYVLVDDYALFKRAVVLFIIVPTVHFILFLLIPVKMNRPNVDGADGIMHLLTHYYYLMDHPVNCFPSLHVSYSFAGTLLMWNYKRRWAYGLLLLTMLVAASVILVKQHYVLDVVGALIVTTILSISLRVLFYTPRR